MTKNTKTVSLVIIAGVLVVLMVLIGRDIFLRRSETLNCEDGIRHRIDIRDFSTQFAAYSLELEANIADKASISTKLSPVQLQQMSEAMQNAQEFRKYVVAGFNSCAITKTQYARLGARFQALDNLAREINEITKHATLSSEDQIRLTGLTAKYGELARKLGSY
jgi:hypothetical protein